MTRARELQELVEDFAAGGLPHHRYARMHRLARAVARSCNVNYSDLLEQMVETARQRGAR